MPKYSSSLISSLSAGNVRSSVLHLCVAMHTLQTCCLLCVMFSVLASERKSERVVAKCLKRMHASKCKQAIGVGVCV